MVNGYRFHTTSKEKCRKTQNSGVVVKGEHGNNIVDFFGVLEDIIEVEYLVGKKKVLIFKCKWWNTEDRNGLHIDKEGNICSVNFSRTWYNDQPCILADQVHQVFYLNDLRLGRNWHVVQRFSHRNSYDIPQQLDKGPDEEVYQEEEPSINLVVDLNFDMPSLARGTLSLHMLPSNSVHTNAMKVHQGSLWFMMMTLSMMMTLMEINHSLTMKMKTSGLMTSVSQIGPLHFIFFLNFLVVY
ncbi:hypothetical protein ACH5RR_026421 [Cinchona calisaya]|uniref:DUF4216 domain-containing protein n=1 Tax=Cinchona calisaya TaxID=153742 RepID=A0ABD2Z2I3_9GENT